MANLADYDVETTLEAVLMESIPLAGKGEKDEVRELVLEMEKPMELKAGQSIGVLVYGTNPFGAPYHFRLYTIADTPEYTEDGRPVVKIAVKRCNYIDEFNGEEYKGIASNYLCDRKAGDVITISGPYGIPFTVPENKKSNLLMIGLGTGIAPFRAFIKHIYQDLGGWNGKVRLFYGAKSGPEKIYLNNRNNDLKNYYDEETFKAFESVSPRPYVNDPIQLGEAFEKHAKEVKKLVLQPDTHVYVAGLLALKDTIDKSFKKILGSEEEWSRRKAELKAGKRWQEILY